MRRRPWALMLLALSGGCGPEQSHAPPLPTGKVPPTLTRRVRGRTLEEWLARAESPEAALRAEAPWALVELSSDMGVLGPVLERLVEDRSVDVRYASLVALGRIPGALGGRLEAALRSGLTSPERGLALAAASALVQGGERSAAPLAQVLAQGSEGQAREAARLLFELGPAALGAAPALARALGTAPLAVRLNAARTLELLGAEALGALGEALPQAQGEGALALIELIRAQGPRAEVVQEALLGALASADPAVALAAEGALVGVGTAALSRLDALSASAGAGATAAARAAARIRAASPR